jgi:hypothetical protein
MNMCGIQEDDNNNPLVNRGSGSVDPHRIYILLTEAEKFKDITWPKIQLIWNTLLEDHYSAFTHGLISPLCREWLWAVYREVLLLALDFGLMFERLAVEKQPGMSVGCTPRAHQTLSTKVLLFASDAQVYGFDRREELQARYKTLREAALVQSKSFLQRQFEFQIPGM